MRASVSRLREGNDRGCTQLFRYTMRRGRNRVGGIAGVNCGKTLHVWVDAGCNGVP